MVETAKAQIYLICKMGRKDKRKYEKNCSFSFKRKMAAWNKRKGKTMALDTQVNLAESDKGSFHNQNKWLEEYEYGKGTCFIVITVMTSGRLLLYFQTNLLFW